MSYQLTDSFGRTINNLRVSVTDQCNFRCIYCMPEVGMIFQPKEEILTFEEIYRFVEIATGLGISKLRLTGGEPTVRKDLPLLVRMLSKIPGVQDMAMTTNGFLLRKMAREPARGGTAPDQRQPGYAGRREVHSDDPSRRPAQGSRRA